jgi:hypothetical protein
VGGYRRSLDGVSGSAVTTPCLLYRDGWYLLDDTTSAIFDTATQTVHQRLAPPPPSAIAELSRVGRASPPSKAFAGGDAPKTARPMEPIRLYTLSAT